MHYFKKFICLLALVGFSALSARQTHDNHLNNLTTIVTVLNDSLHDELARIDKQLSLMEPIKGNYHTVVCDGEIHMIKNGGCNVYCYNLDEVNNIITQELPAIKIKFADTFNNKLTPDQRKIVISLLHNLKSLSAITVEDFKCMCQLYDINQYNNFIAQIELVQPSNDAKFFAVLEETDFNNRLFNLMKNFLCKSMHINDLFSIGSPLKHQKANLFEKLINDTFTTTALSCNLLTGNCYVSPDLFLRTGENFKIMHPVIQELLEAVEQQ